MCADGAPDARSDAEEEGIESVRASIERYLAKYSEGVARKEAATIQARRLCGAHPCEAMKHRHACRIRRAGHACL